MARVFSSKHSSTFVDNVGIYSVGTKSVHQIGQSGKTLVSRGKALPVSYSRNTTVFILS